MQSKREEGNQRSHVIVIGAAMFAMFFGAGNLIFPPAIGLETGQNWIWSLIGFNLTGIGLPVLGVLAVSRAGGTIFQLAGRVNKTFARVIGTITVLAIGPLLAIPRTGATVYEMGIRPAFPNVSPILAVSVYFMVTLVLVLTPSKIIDRVGKILTPILLGILALIIISGIINPIGEIVTTDKTTPFAFGFINGYQTMDTFTAVLMGGLILSALLKKGYTKAKEQMRITMKAGLIAGAGLAFVYSGLLFLGATASGVFDAGMARTDLVINIAKSVFGPFGQLSLSLAVSAACLTTAVGITAIVGNFFETLTDGKLKYKHVVTFTCLFSIGVAVMGVEQIVKIAVPLLAIVYPILIVLILMGLMDQYITYKAAYKGAVLGAFVVGTYDALKAMTIEMGSIGLIFEQLPLVSSGFGWAVPAVLLAFLAAGLQRAGLFNKEVGEIVQA
jgi:branched-chain amino acid:cation transporter, LIVCS family